jgi:protein MpaA
MSFFWPRSVDFSYAGQNCFVSPVLLPNLVAKNQGETFAVQPSKSLTIAGYPLYSHTACVTPTEAPLEHGIEDLSLSPLGISFLKKTIRVSTGGAPQVEYKAALTGPVSTKDPLILPLSSGDQVFDYRLVVGEQQVTCHKDQSNIICEVDKLKLEQSAGYSFVLQRWFGGKLHKNLFEQNVSTVGAVVVTKSSIGAGETFFNVPTKLQLTFNKPVRSFDGVKLEQVAGKERTEVPVTASADGQTLTINLIKPLERRTTFELSVGSIAAPDGGHLPKTFVLPFTTSGGPKVKGVSVGSYKVSTATNVTLTFDSAVSEKQDLGKFVTVEVGSDKVGASVSQNGKTVTINPSASLPKCTRFKVTVKDGLENKYGVSGGSAWQYSSRTICQTVFSIGSSVQGRSILAYRFGNGNSRILYVGGTHGNEKSSVYTLNSWIDYLERNYDGIPAGRMIVVIPNLNPDGFAAGTRTNARNVDLNRNFPANDWKKGVTMPGGSYNPNGGGSKPLSEPESKALASYVLGHKPRLVLTFHAAAGVVMPNDAGDSDKLARLYDQKSNLYYQPASETGDIFTYDTTGAFEDWLRDKVGVPALLIEHWTMSSNEFYKNQPAMWYMARLP